MKEDHNQGLQLISVHHAGAVGALGDLSGFRQEFYRCLTGRADALFEPTDAALCADGPVTSVVELSLEPEHHRRNDQHDDAIDVTEPPSTQA